MNMHVPDPRRDAVVRAWLKTDLAALTTQDLAEQRAGNRAILAARYEMIWAACEPHVKGACEDRRSGPGAPGDPEPVIVDYRFVDLGVKVLDRMYRLLEVGKADPEAPADPAAGVPDGNVAVVTAALDAMEAKRAEAQGALGLGD